MIIEKWRTALLVGGWAVAVFGCNGDSQCAPSNTDSGASPSHDASMVTDTGTGTIDAASSDVDAASPDAHVPVQRFALSFDGGADGMADQVEFPSDLGDVGTRFTLEAWVRPTSSTPGSSEGEGGMIFEHAGGCTSNFWLEWSGNVARTPDRFRFWVYPTTGCDGAVSAEAATASTLGIWHHVAGVFEDGAMRLYVDGALASTAHQPNPISWTQVYGHWAGRDGYDARPTRSGFIGEIDEIRISRIARYAGASFTPPAHLDADGDTVAAWLFDEGAGTSTVDASPNHYDGVVSGAAWVGSSR